MKELEEIKIKCNHQAKHIETGMKHEKHLRDQIEKLKELLTFLKMKSENSLQENSKLRNKIIREKEQRNKREKLQYNTDRII